MLCIVLVLSLSSCMSTDDENKITFKLSSDGTVTQVIVDDADGSVTGEELENYINESISEFQSRYSGESISLEKCKVDGSKINITLTYSSVSAYALFNNVSCFVGTLKDAYDAGFDFERSFYSLNGTSIPYYELPRYCADCYVLILEEAVSVELPGDAYIVSTGVTVGSDKAVSVDENYSDDYQAKLTNPVCIIYK